MNFKLRDYQIECLKRIKNYLNEDLEKRIILVYMSMGAGKSWVIAETIKQNALNKNVLVVQPTIELKDQNKEKFLLAVKDLNIPTDKIMFETTAKIHSDIKRGLIDSSSFDLIIFDEIHKFEPNNISYMNIYKTFIDKPKLGFTGSPYRYINKSEFCWKTKSVKVKNTLVMLSKEYPQYFTDPIFNVNHNYLVNQGYLINPKYIHYYQPELNPELRHFFIKNADNYIPDNIDFNSLEEYGRAYSKNCMISLLNALYEYSKIKKKIIVYCNTTYQIKLFEKMYPEFKITQLTDKTTKKERDKIIKNFREAEKSILFNCKVLTTGFDIPELDCIIVATNLTSLTLYVQIVGRLIRCNNGNENKKPVFVDLFGSFKRFGKLSEINMKRDYYLYVNNTRADLLFSDKDGYELKLKSSKLSNNKNFL